jgi:predicted AlkP superfamily pyrophosphatase or phosphodiesterase
MLWAVLALLAAGPAAPQEKARAERVVVISVDGLRPDAIEAAGASNLLGLIKAGAFCPKAETIRPSVTLPSHASMLTGLSYKRHGVTFNDWHEGHIRHPTVFAVVHEAKGATAAFFAKEKFHYLTDPKYVDSIYGDAHEARGPPTKAADIADAFARAWSDKPPVFTFVHLREPDSAGHKHGWMGPEYLAAVKQADEAIGKIVASMRARGGFDKNALIVSADHGGKGKDHHQDIPDNTTIPWICVGPRVPAGLLIDRVVRTYDTAPTALAFLNLGIPGKIDGKIVEEVFPK